MALSFLYRAFCRVLQLLRLISRRDTDLAIEVVVLRHEVAVLRRQVHRPALEPADRAVLAGLARLLPRQRVGQLFVQPATLLRWHRDLVAKRWTHSHGRPGRPSVAEGTTALVLRRAQRQPGVPIAEVSRFTGHSTRELMDLVQAGVLEQVPGRRACELKVGSLRTWLTDAERLPEGTGASRAG